MGVPWETPPMANVILADVPLVVPIDWPHRSVISKIIVVQTTGVKESFTVALYNHPLDETVSDSEGEEVGQIPDDCFRITPDLEANSDGQLVYFSEESTGGYGYVFFSQKALSGRQGQRENKVYMRITPKGSGEKRIAICIGGQKEIE